MMERFLKKYAANIKIYGHQMQSLDYQVIDKILDYDKDIPAFSFYLIIPFSLEPRHLAIPWNIRP